MKVEQIYNIVNDSAKNALGGEAIVAVDTSSFVSLGQQIINSGTTIEQFYKALVDRIGRTVIAIRKYSYNNRMKIRRNNMEYGIILQKVSYDFPDSVTNPVWIFDKQKSPYDVETSTNVTQELFSAAGAFSFEDKIPTKQIKSAFINPTIMGAFISGLYTNWNNAYTLALENLDKLAVNTGIAYTLSSGNTVCARNLLSEYNTATGKTLTASNCLTDQSFLLFASSEIGIVVDSIKEMKRIYNIKGQARFTPEENLVVQLLSRFTRATDMYLYSSTFHDDMVKLPLFDSVSTWQGTGTSNSFNDVSTINVIFKNGEETKTVTQSGVIAYIRDVDAVATTVYDESVTTVPSELSKVIVYQHEAMLGYMFDPRENGVVFYVA